MLGEGGVLPGHQLLLRYWSCWRRVLPQVMFHLGIVNAPEAAVIAGVGGKTSHLTLTSYKQFGDHFPHLTCTATLTLSQIGCIAEEVDPWDFKSFVKEIKMCFRLNSIHLSF